MTLPGGKSQTLLRGDPVKKARGRSPRMRACSCGIPSHPLPRGRGSLRSSTGSTAPTDGSRGRSQSCKHQLVGTGHPLGKPLTVSAFRHIVTSQPLDVVGQLGSRHLVSSELATEPRIQPQATSKVDLVSLDLIAVGPNHELALQADVGYLDPGARVRATV